MTTDYSSQHDEWLKRSRRSRRILIGLLLLPAGLFALVAYDRTRLTAMADHGQAVTAHITSFERDSGHVIADVIYQFAKQNYTTSIEVDDTRRESLQLVVLADNPGHPYFGPPLTPDVIRTHSIIFF